MPDFPVLQTERLILRCPEAADLDGFAEMMGDPQAGPVPRRSGSPQRSVADARHPGRLLGDQGHGMFSVIHTIDPGNGPSQALAKRVGSRYLRPGRLPAPIDLDLDVWGQSRAEWRARKA